MSSPGPGGYESPARMGDGLSYTIGEKRDSGNKNKNPGPGDYEARESQTKERIVTYQIAKSKRVDIVSREARNQPGPGNYGSPSKLGDGIKYNIGEKRDPARDNGHPGPGTYNNDDRHLRDSSPSYDMGGKSA